MPLRKPVSPDVLSPELREPNGRARPNTGLGVPAHRNAEARIDLGQLGRNIEITRTRLVGTKLLFPVKADEYGHGSREIALRAQEAGVDGFGVGNLFEARRLREAGVTAPILILSPSRPELADELVDTDAAVAISCPEMAGALEGAAAAASRTVPVHVKVDTGLGRDGLPVEAASHFVEHLRRSCPHLEVEGIFSHLSVAYSEEEDARAYTRRQIDSFNELLAILDRRGLLPPLRHIANSSALVQHRVAVTSGYLNMVRPGILLYGYPEVRRPWTDEIRPILSLVTWVVSLKDVPPGRSLGYGRAHRTRSWTKIATLPVGYGDGIPPGMARACTVVVGGHRAPIIGGVSMDQMSVEVTKVPGGRVGDEVELLGGASPADEVARALDLGVTEILLTGISPHLKRTFR